MFQSARLKLTLFYLAILLGFSLLLTLGFRAFVQAEFNHANDVQRGAVHDIGQQYQDQFDTPSVWQPDRSFERIQRAQAQQTQNRLTHEALWLNIGVFVVGGLVSYWYAGRTLRPIQEAHEKQKRFTSDASHELRTPLASLRLENEIFLRQKSFTDTEVREQVASNLEEVSRLERLTTSLLDLNHYENGSLPKTQLDIRKVVREAVKRTEQVNAAHPQPVQFTVQMQKATIAGEEAGLTQLIGILLDNAIKYGGTKKPIEIHGSLEENSYILAVRDHGPGITETDLPYIFERMYRGDKARSNVVSGHGIGLSLAEQIAQAHGATIVAANHPKGGAVFTVSFPV